MLLSERDLSPFALAAVLQGQSFDVYEGPRMNTVAFVVLSIPAPCEYSWLQLQYSFRLTKCYALKIPFIKCYQCVKVKRELLINFAHKVQFSQHVEYFVKHHKDGMLSQALINC